MSEPLLIATDGRVTSGTNSSNLNDIAVLVGDLVVVSASVNNQGGTANILTPALLAGSTAVVDPFADVIRRFYTFFVEHLTATARVTTAGNLRVVVPTSSIRTVNLTVTVWRSPDAVISATSNNQDTATPVAPATGTMTVDDVVVSVLSVRAGVAGVSITPSAGYTVAENRGSTGTTDCPHLVEYRTAPTVGSYAGAPTLSVSRNAIAGNFTLRAGAVSVNVISRMALL